jgi:hypothetical protein
MRLIAVPIVATLALAVPSGAVADDSVAPPGNSGISQYLEVVPTAGGNKPANKHSRARKVLNHHQNTRLVKVGGADGQRLANLVNATSPAGSSSAAPSKSGTHAKHKAKNKAKNKNKKSTQQTTTTSSDDRQAHAVAAAYGNGGDGGGPGSGIGVPLIVLMGAAALLVGAAALGRRLAGGGGGGTEGEPQL